MAVEIITVAIIIQIRIIIRSPTHNNKHDCGNENIKFLTLKVLLIKPDSHFAVCMRHNRIK